MALFFCPEAAAYREIAPVNFPVNCLCKMIDLIIWFQYNKEYDMFFMWNNRKSPERG